MDESLVFVTQPTGRLLWMSPALQAKTGFAVDDGRLTEGLQLLMHPEDDPEPILRALSDLAQSDQRASRAINHRMITRWGESLPMSSVISMTDWHGHVAFRVECYPREQRAAEEERYRALVKAISDGIVRVDAEGRFYYSNGRFQELVAVNAASLRTVRFPTLFHPGDRQQVALLVSRVAERREQATLEVRSTHGLWLELRMHPARTDEGAVIIVVRDITEQRKMQDQLRHTQKLESLGVFAGGIAHDFNNLLTAMVANISLLELEELSGEARDCLDDIRNAAERAAQLTSSMLAYSGGAPLDHRYIDLAHVVRQILPLIRAATTTRVQLEVAGETSNVVVHADESQLTQVVMNLLTNAAESFGDKGGSVVAEVSVIERPELAALDVMWPIGLPDGDSFAMLEVRDRGRGISPATLERMFDPFFTTKETGRGLGLAAVLGIVRSRGGSVGIHTAEGVGTAMHVVLPRVTMASAPPTTPSTEIPRGTGTILFVDDEAALRDVAKRILARAGYTVLVATSGMELLERLNAEPDRFDLVVLDETMPGLTGSQVVEELRPKWPNLRVLRTSGFSKMPVPTQPATAFLAKPYSSVALARAVAELMSRALN